MARRRRTGSGISRTPCSLDMTLDGREVEVSWTRVTEWSFDPKYGADADGNRGIPQWDYSDDEPEDIEVVDLYAGTRVDALSKEQLALVDAAIEAKQNETTPEQADDDEPPEEDHWEREERRRERLGAGY